MAQLYVNVQFLAQVLADIGKFPITSQTIKCRYKFKSNQKTFLPKMLKMIPPRWLLSFKSLAQVLADICKCPISSQTIKNRYKFKSNPKKISPKNACMDPPKVCTKFGLTSTSLS